MTSRRRFLQHLAALTGIAALPTSASAKAVKPLQVSPLAGFQYHSGATLWPRLAIGQPLHLVREPDNSFDPRAVRVDWCGHKIGYIPRLDNAAISQLLDGGEQLDAVIAGLMVSNDPWKRVRVEVRWTI